MPAKFRSCAEVDDKHIVLGYRKYAMVSIFKFNDKDYKMLKNRFEVRVKGMKVMTDGVKMIKKMFN